MAVCLLFCLVQNTYSQADTFSIYHHNYLVERQADLMVFAEEMVAYIEAHSASGSVRKSVLEYHEEISAVDVWKSTDVVATMNELDMLRSRGEYLHGQMVRAVEKAQWRKGINYTIGTILPFVLAILALPLVYNLLFRRR